MIAEISENLLSKKTELTQRIAAIEADFKKGRSADFAEQISERENDEVLDEIHHEAKAELSLVCQALQRIDAGRYDVCDSCAQTIAPARLTALPYTTKCIECAN